MRVAAIYDVHGNIDALDAVLEEVEALGIEHVVVGGDIAWGPFPAEVVTRIRSIDAEVIRGNADREVAARAGEADGLEPWVAEVNVWCARQLESRDLEFLATLPETVVVPVDGMGDVFLCHATPVSDDEIMTAITPAQVVAAMLTKVEQQTVVCGHTHSQFDRVVGERRIVNAGSVGLPYEDAPGAYWAIIGPDVTFRRTDYDLPTAAARIRNSGCPHADSFVDAVLAPTPRAEATATFEARRSSK